MINENSIRSVSSSRLGAEFVAPLVGSYCYGRIPQTILGLYDGQLNDKCLPVDTVQANFSAPNKVVVLMIDALGWCFVKDFIGTHPFLQRFAAQGIVSQLTAQFPSTTSVHVTTMHTGTPLSEHGIPEYRYFEPLVGDIINPFKFCLQRDKEVEGLKGVVAPEAIYPRTTFYESLNKRAIRSHVFLTPKANDSSYNRVMTRGASVLHIFDDLSRTVEGLGAAIKAEQQRGYFYFYYDGIDKACHKFGPDGTETKDEIKAVLDSLESLYGTGVFNAPGTATILIADHGHMGVDTRNSIFVDLIYPEINKHLMLGTDGKPMAPGGSPRDMFVYTTPESTEEVVCELGKRLAGKAVVYRTTELVEKGIFGANPSAALLGRLPSVIILPIGNHTIWSSTDVKVGKYKLGHHGGMSPEEMVIPCMVLQR